MNDAIADEDDIVFMSMNLCLIQGKRQCSLYDQINLVLHVPVIWHVETWMVAIDMVEFDREVKSPALTKFIISIVLHKIGDSFLIKIILL